MNRFVRATVVLASLAATACGGGGETKGDSQTAAAPKAGGTFTIAMIAKSSTNPVFLAARTGAETVARWVERCSRMSWDEALRAFAR